VTLGDANFRKSLMKMIYRKLPKTASLPVTGFVSAGISVSVLADAIPIVSNSRKIAPVAKR